MGRTSSTRGENGQIKTSGWQFAIVRSLVSVYEGNATWWRRMTLVKLTFQMFVCTEYSVLLNHILIYIKNLLIL